jgi:hypothetical protein
MGMSDSNDDICLDCGKQIANTVFPQRLGPFEMMAKQVHCLDCGFARFRREKTCCRKPYRDPWSRLMTNGKPPEWYAKELDAMKNRMCQDGMMGGAL